jgi:hypothetical protein
MGTFHLLNSAHGRMMRFDSVQEKDEIFTQAIDFFEQENQLRGQLEFHATGN